MNKRRIRGKQEENESNTRDHLPCNRLATGSYLAIS
jgi:hypothetical protein